MIIISVVSGALSSAAVYFLLSWQIRSRLRECEFVIELWHDERVRATKRAAQEASVAVRRQKAAAGDEPLIEAAAAKLRAASLSGDPDATVPAPWWTAIMKGRPNGTEPR